MLDVLVQSRRDKKAAQCLLRKLLKKQRCALHVMITDKLRSHRGLKQDFKLGGEHRQHKGTGAKAPPSRDEVSST